MQRRAFIKSLGALLVAAGSLSTIQPVLAQSAILSYERLSAFWTKWFELARAINPKTSLRDVEVIFNQAMTMEFGSISVKFIRPDGTTVEFTGTEVRMNLLVANFIASESFLVVDGDGEESEDDEISFPIFRGEAV